MRAVCPVHLLKSTTVVIFGVEKNCACPYFLVLHRRFVTSFVLGSSGPLDILFSNTALRLSVGVETESRLQQMDELTTVCFR